MTRTRLKQVLAAHMCMSNDIEEALNNEKTYNNSLKMAEIELKQELNISLAIIADCMLEDRQGSGTQEETNEKTIKIINNLCDQVEGCDNCFYNNIGGKCLPMEFIDELEKGKEKG